LRDAGEVPDLPIEPNTSHRTLHHLAGVRFRFPPGCCATFYVSMVTSDTEVPLLLVEQGA
jgi:hypothetical protein